MNEGTNPLGNIYVSHRAIATIAYETALESYGVVGFTARNLAEGIAQVIIKDPTLGVELHYDGKTVQVDLYIIVEYGTRLPSVAESISSSVRFQIEKTFGLPVTEVNVHVRGLRISNPD
ncbi:MAG: Asp23/Gls24 family envelope stress response protein [Anaerolineaceae bacterium]